MGQSNGSGLRIWASRLSWTWGLWQKPSIQPRNRALIVRLGVLLCRVKAPPPGLWGCTAETRPKIYRGTAPKTIVWKDYPDVRKRSHQTKQELTHHAERLAWRAG
jgi:hypothetical protein